MTASSPRPKARMTGTQRREQLIGIGRAVFAERGYEAASVEEIAERADVSKPLVYEHFGGKEGLYAVIVDREVRTLVDSILGALDATDHPREAVEGSALAFLTYIEEHREGFQILVRDAPVGTTTGTLPSVLGEVAARAESILAKHFKARGYEPKLAPLYARALVGMVTLVGQWWLDSGKPKRADVAAHIVNLAWNGLKDLDAKPSPRKPAS
jgi:AcrR family transcriptional regulator